VRILYVTNGFPYPLTSGRLRQYHFIRELARQHRVILASIVGKDFRPEYARALEPFTECVHTVASNSFKSVMVRKLRDRTEMLLTGCSRPLRSLRKVIEQVLRDGECDATICTLATVPAFTQVQVPRFIVDVCDAPLLHIQGRMRHAGWRRRLPLWLASHWFRSLQQIACNRADHVVFSTARDRDAVLGPNGDRGIVIPNGVDVDFWKRSTSRLGKNTVIFTGGMYYPPNVDAALFLIQEILPRVQRCLADVRLLIVGHSPPDRLIEAGRRAGVAVTGFVEDMRPFLEHATLFAAPLRFGAGIQNKLLEALSMEIPVVTTALAAEGLRLPGSQLPPVQVARTADDFAHQIIQSLLERNPTGELHSAGRQYVADHFSWTRSGDLLEVALESSRCHRRRGDVWAAPS
jgi:glycosyltransferase involved in cell wall biosynthesis